MRVRLGLPLLLVLVLLVVTSSVSASRVRRVSGDQRAASADSSGEIQRGASRQQRFLFNLEFPKDAFRYYERPKFRYPYFNDNGKGVVLYGYGDKYLYNYSLFKTIEGYSRRR